MARRLYLGKLPADVRSEEVQDLFKTFGRIVDVRIMSGFGFVEYETSRDAEDAVAQFNGRSFPNTPFESIAVEFAKDNRSRRTGGADYEPRDRGAYTPRKRPGIRLVVDGVSRDTSWQDLKDFGREAGSVSFADIDRDVPGRGVLEYQSREDADHAVKYLDNKELRGQPVRVTFAEDRGGPDNFRRDDRHRDDRYRDDREDRYRDRDRHDRGDKDDRVKDDRYRRGRSASPPRRDDRVRSPRRDYDDRRSARDDRAAEPFEKRRDDRRPREDRDSRYEGGSSRANGDGANWSR